MYSFDTPHKNPAKIHNEPNYYRLFKSKSNVSLMYNRQTATVNNRENTKEYKI